METERLRMQVKFASLNEEQTIALQSLLSLGRKISDESNNSFYQWQFTLHNPNDSRYTDMVVAAQNSQLSFILTDDPNIKEWKTLTIISKNRKEFLEKYLYTLYFPDD